MATYFLKEIASRYGRGPTTLSADAYGMLLSAPWPGNVRELKNMIEAAAVLSASPEIQAADLHLNRHFHAPAIPSSLTFKEAKQQVTEAFEREFISRALRRHQGNITKAAEEMDLHRQQLQQKIRELGLREWRDEGKS